MRIPSALARSLVPLAAAHKAAGPSLRDGNSTWEKAVTAVLYMPVGKGHSRAEAAGPTRSELMTGPGEPREDTAHASTPLLDRIASPEDLKALPLSRLPELAAEVRQELIDVVTRNG